MPINCSPLSASQLLIICVPLHQSIDRLHFRLLLSIADILPVKENSFISTRDFLLRVIQVCLDFINESNDRSTKVVRFIQPEELLKKFDFEIGQNPRNLEQTIQDCAAALYHQVRTGECTFYLKCSLRLLDARQRVP